jgi:hypothetical protein
MSGQHSLRHTLTALALTTVFALVVFAPQSTRAQTPEQTTLAPLKAADAAALLAQLKPTLTDDTNSAIRHNAAASISAIGTAYPSYAGEALRMLAALSEDTDEALRLTAIAGLTSIGKTHPHQAHHAINALVSFQNDNTTAAIQTIQTAHLIPTGKAQTPAP